LFFGNPQIYRGLAMSVPCREHQFGWINCRLPPGVKRAGEITMRRSVGDYRSLLAGAVSTLANESAEVREELYERARAELKAEFDKLDPPASELEILEERLKLNLAIHDFEWSFEWTAAEVA
jgi:hypothetical protein